MWWLYDLTLMEKFPFQTELDAQTAQKLIQMVTPDHETEIKEWRGNEKA